MFALASQSEFSIPVVAWCQLDPRFGSLLPDGELVGLGERASIRGGKLTREVSVAFASGDPERELAELGEAIADSGLPIEVVRDDKLLARSDDLVAEGLATRLIGRFSVRLQTLRETKDDLRDELERIALLRPFFALAELSPRVTLLSYTRDSDRPAASVTLAVDDDSRGAMLAWLEAQGFAADGTLYRRGHEVVTYDDLFDQLTATID